MVEVAELLAAEYFCCRPVWGLNMGTSMGSATLERAMFCTGVPVK